MNTMTEQEAYLRLAALCAQAEHCEYEMQEKMRRWEIADDAQARVMQRLITERYVDDERFARAFANDKVKYNKWGRRKVEQAMWLKHIAEDIRKRVLDSIDDEEYIAILRPLLQQKRRSVKAHNDYELRQKLIKFAIGRGFTMNIIKQCISIDDEEEYDME